MDKNAYWEKIHNFIEENFDGGKARFNRNINVLTYFEENELHRCNIIIIQYLISFFYDTIGPRGLRRWFSNLAENIVRNKPKNSPLLIVINDVDSINTGRDAFPLFIEEIERVGLEISYDIRRRFKDHNHYIGSSRYVSNQNIFSREISDSFAKNYCVAKYCESAQLILEVI